MCQSNSISSETRSLQRFRETVVEATPELLEKARALIEATGSMQMRQSFEASLAELPEPKALTVLIGI